MNEQDTVFSTHVGPEGAPAVGTRMAITVGRPPPISVERRMPRPIRAARGW